MTIYIKYHSTTKLGAYDDQHNIFVMHILGILPQKSILTFEGHIFYIRW